MIIYRIINTLNNKAYIGQTIRTLHERWKEHRKMSNKSDFYFHRAIKKYGKEIWQLDEREIYWINHYNTFVSGYNSTTGGDNKKTISLETRKKMSLKQLGKKHSLETKEKMRLIKLGKKGRKNTEETKEKMRLSAIKRGKNSVGNTGKTHNEETRKKLSNARKSQKGLKRGPYKKKSINTIESTNYKEEL